MPLVHKSVAIREEVWRQLRIHAELTGVPVRDFLSYLIMKSSPIPEGDKRSREELSAIGHANSSARESGVENNGTFAMATELMKSIRFDHPVE